MELTPLRTQPGHDRTGFPRRRSGQPLLKARHWTQSVSLHAGCKLTHRAGGQVRYRREIFKREAAIVRLRRATADVSVGCLRLVADGAAEKLSELRKLVDIRSYVILIDDPENVLSKVEGCWVDRPD